MERNEREAHAYLAAMAENSRIGNRAYDDETDEDVAVVIGGLAALAFLAFVAFAGYCAWKLLGWLL